LTTPAPFVECQGTMSSATREWLTVVVVVAVVDILVAQPVVHVNLTARIGPKVCIAGGECHATKASVGTVDILIWSVICA
jgi:adenosylcobinamide amidohydrolase